MTLFVCSSGVCECVQILEGLHSSSLELLERWNTVVSPLPRRACSCVCVDVCVCVCVPQIVPTLPEPKQKTKVEFLLGDATVYDWSNATMWFANSTCFDEALMLKLATVAGTPACAPGACVFVRPCVSVCPSASSALSADGVFPPPDVCVCVPLHRQASGGHVCHHVHEASAVGQVDGARARGVHHELGQRNGVHPEEDHRVSRPLLSCVSVAPVSE